MSAEMLDTMEQINANANRLVSGITADQWEAQTPCSEWKVRDLVNHMAGTTRFFASAAKRTDPEHGPDEDHLGDDPVTSFKSITESTMAAWRSDGALEGMVTQPGEMPAQAALGINILDTGTHCWDLATAIGADHGLTEQQIAMIDQWNRQVISDEVRSGGGFGQVLDVAEEGDPLTSMLAFVGREG